MEPVLQHIRIYRDSGGREPFVQWLEQLGDIKGSRIIKARISRLSFGNFGDHHAISEGLYELRIHFGPGYRIYFGKVGFNMVILLAGGDKGSQTKDIGRAFAYWEDFRRLL